MIHDKVTFTLQLMFPDLESLTSRNIAVGYTPGVLTDATAELTVALLLATSRSGLRVVIS